MIIEGVQLVGEDGAARQITVSNSRIVHVGHPSANLAREDRRLVFEDAIAFPGLTNSHDHLEFNVYPPLRHRQYVDYIDWGRDIHCRNAELISAFERLPRADRLRWGALKNLLCGVTTVAHHGNGRDDVRSLPIGIARATSIHSLHWAPLWRLQLNKPIGRPPYAFHIGEGVSAAVEEEVDELTRWNLFHRPLVGVHAIAMRPDQATRFRAVVWCPISNEFLYGTTADVGSLKRNTTVLLGSDSTLTADWNFWNHLRRARALRRLNDRQLFESVTQKAAHVWIPSRSGRLVAGEPADLVIARKKAADTWDAFFAVDPEDILLVLKGGAVVLCDASLHIDWPAAGPRSIVRLGDSEKFVAEDVPPLVALIRRYGLEPNLPITADPVAAAR